MLKRYQVILNDWLVDHIRKISEKYDISFSETIRTALCLAYIGLIAKDYPKYKSNMKDVQKRATLREGNYNKVQMEQFHKDLSRLYFEAQKAIEFIWQEEGKSGK
jgi:hypothetical protein